jgi:hypothetical protein
MNLNKDECDKWRSNPEVNPRTGRSIKHKGPTYNAISKDCNITKEMCKEFKKTQQDIL